MYSAASSYRSTASSSSRNLRRIVPQQQEYGATTMSDSVAENSCRSRAHSQDYSAKSSSVSSSSASYSVVSSVAFPSSVSSIASVSQRRPPRDSPVPKSSGDLSKAPMIVFLRMLLLRCFTTRRKRRNRGRATRKMKNSNYQTRDDFNNEDRPAKRNYSSIPTNEHELFMMLHKTKSKRNNLTTQQQKNRIISSSSSHGRSSNSSSPNTARISGSSNHGRSSSSSRTSSAGHGAIHSHSMDGSIQQHQTGAKMSSSKTKPPGLITPPYVDVVIEKRSEAQPLLLF